jgi:hypothetical protein
MASTVGAESIGKFKKSYKNDQQTALTRDELMQLMMMSGFYSDEVSALFVGIAERESNFRPGSINGNRETKDFSFGFLQMNLLPAAHGTKTFRLTVPSETNVLGLKLAYSTTSDTDPTILRQKVQELASIETTDERIFIPLNQIGMLLVVIDQNQARKIYKRRQTIR